VTTATIALTVTGAALAATGSGYIIAANYQYWQLQYEMNERLPDDQKFDPLFWTPFAWERFTRLRKAVLPDSPRPIQARRYAVIGFVLFFSGVGLVLVTANVR